MAYTKTNWTESTPIDTTNLQKIEDGLEELSRFSTADYDSLPVGAIVDFEGDEIPIGYEEVKVPNTYSYEEVKTSKTWIDGKPIYRKVIQDTTVRSAGAYDIVGIPSELENIVNINCYAYQSTSNNIFIASTSPFDSENKFSAYISENRLSVRSSWEIKKITIILEYTKTTDEEVL